MNVPLPSVLGYLYTHWKSGHFPVFAITIFLSREMSQKYYRMCDTGKLIKLRKVIYESERQRYMPSRPKITNLVSNALVNFVDFG